MHPIAVIHDRPERVAVERAQIGDDRHGDFLDAFLMQRQRQMMMVDDEIALLRPEDHRDHVLAEKFTAFLHADFAPVLALGLDLAHADSDLGRTKFGNGDRGQ